MPRLNTLKILLPVTFLLSACAPDVPAETIRSEKHEFRVVTIAEGLDHPWSVAFLPDGSALITEREGRLRLLRDGKLVREPIAGVPSVYASNQGGLFDVLPHPDFARNRFVYLAYAAPTDNGAHTRVMRFRLDVDARALTQPHLIFDAKPKAHGGRHFGGRMIFDRAGFLYITVGDRGDMQRAQRLDDHAGSVIRLTADGRTPTDNPFVGRNGALPQIWSYGHRNPQGIDLHPDTGAVWTHEHGARGGDEVNIIHRGRNYGWPVITHGVDYDGSKIGVGSAAPGMEQPLYYWVPSIAPSGMAFYRGDKFPEWNNSLFVGALAGETLVRLQLDGNEIRHEERLLKDRVGRIRAVRLGPDGYLYLTQDDSNGRLLRLEPVK